LVIIVILADPKLFFIGNLDYPCLVLWYGRSHFRLSNHKTEAICGPVGNCNSVQGSQYALLFGVIPVGALGLAGYAAILAAWLFRQSGPKSWSKPLSLAIWLFAWFGILFRFTDLLEP
jgi:uncharacterized membrane protein